MTTTQHDEAVERAARAICGAQPHMQTMKRLNEARWLDEINYGWKDHVTEALAAIAALSATAAPAGEEVARLRAALVEAAIPLEAMFISGRPLGVSRELWRGVINGARRARAALETQAGGE